MAKILRKNRNQGFALIDFIIYIVITALVLIAIFNFVWEIIYGNIKAQAIREVQQNSRLAMEKITEAILDASAINSPAMGGISDSLSLSMQDLGLDPALFQIINNKLIITRGANGPLELTNNRVKVSNLQFSNLSYAGKPGTVRIQMIIEHTNSGNLRQYEALLKTESTVSLRK